jgi:hypothetical protein
VAAKNSKAKRRKLSKRDLLELAELGRQTAQLQMAQFPQGEYRIAPEWDEIKKNHSIREIIGAVRAAQPKRGKGRPVNAKTTAWIERLRGLHRAGRGYLQLAEKFRPELPKADAQAALRRFRSRYAKQIES